MRFEPCEAEFEELAWRCDHVWREDCHEPARMQPMVRGDAIAHDAEHENAQALTNSHVAISTRCFSSAAMWKGAPVKLIILRRLDCQDMLYEW
ncbi:unnamed protein product [Taenia asiatica]|uniref:Uncharacterized protein n=1 Tax=Taenia asiatica TaxID=60517 RepID=A0A0R3VWM3_TAEAS|nr:unnamed protein product [Taenia asiatica]